MRNKKAISISEDTLQQATAIVQDFKEFTSGIRILQLMQRKSDGGICENINLKSVIAKDTQSFKKALTTLLIIKNKSPEPLRIYSSVCSRNLKKAVRYFKQCQLDIDYGSEEEFERLYFHLHGKFISSLMQKSSKVESYFLLDLDQKDNSDVLQQLAENDIDVIKMYPTKQGWHFITSPFNPIVFESKNCSIHTNGLLLLSY